MKKIVINSQFGGFGLSHEATMEYAKLKGITLFAWPDEIAEKVYGKGLPLSSYSIVHYTTVPREEYKKITEEERQNPVGVGRYEKSSKLYFSDRDIPRDDPDLIKVVSTMKKKASRSLAELKIVRIPDDVDWEIEEYDGLETVAEKHREWS
jgi:hypothetical protein